MSRYCSGARKLLEHHTIENIPGLVRDEVAEEYNDKNATANSLVKLQAYLKENEEN